MCGVLHTSLFYDTVHERTSRRGSTRNKMASYVASLHAAIDALLRHSSLFGRVACRAASHAWVYRQPNAHCVLVYSIVALNAGYEGGLAIS